MESIQEAWLKIKLFIEKRVGQWGLLSVILLIAFASFGLGRLSVLSESAPISISHATSAPVAMALGGSYEASRSGHTYYFPWCGGAESIPPKDQVWFKTEDAAQKAGYAPASNCKGL